MNQNTYTIRVKKARSLTILPQLRNMFPREVMAANANSECILMEKVSAVTLKKIVMETDIYIDINNDWTHIPVRTPEYIIDNILNQPIVENHICNDCVTDADIPEEEPVVVEVSQKEEIVEPEPVVEVEVPSAEVQIPMPVDDTSEVETPNNFEPNEMDNKEHIAPQPVLDNIPYKSTPRNNNKNNAKYNNKK